MILSCSVGRHGEKIMRGLGNHVENIYTWQYIMPSRHLRFDINTERLNAFIQAFASFHFHAHQSDIGHRRCSRLSAKRKKQEHTMNFFGQKEEQPKGPDPLFAGELVGECMNLCFRRRI